jgi:endonuclease/exonuclease/phosphatase family metal-dependent hydrolase
MKRVNSVALAVCCLAVACGDVEVEVQVDVDEDEDADEALFEEGEGDVVTELDLAGLPLDEPDDDGADDGDDFGIAEPEPAEEIDVLASTAGDADAADADDADDDVRMRQFRVLHWNIAGGKENNCATAGIRRAVMRFVRDADGPVDVVSLNEVCPAQFQAIREALRKHWDKSDNASFAAFVASGDSRVGNALFSRRGLRNITRLEVGEDEFGKRFLLCGRQVDRRVRVCTTHLSPNDAKARVQLDRVRARIERWWHERRDTVIIGGDLNIQPNDPGLNALYSSQASTRNNPGNTGRYRELDDDDRDHCRGYGERTNPGNGGPCGEGGKIDFIFARANRIVNGAYGADALDIPQDCTGACSDHRAIRGWAKLRYRVD